MFDGWFRNWNDAIGGCLQGGENKVATLSCFPAVFANLLNALLAFSGLTALIMFILGSYKFMNSAGDAKKIQGAKDTFSFAILGLGIALFSFLIINIVSTVTNTPCITKFGFGCE